MGQTECLKILKEDKWMPTSEVAEKLDQRTSLVSRSLSKLFNQNYIFKKSIVEEGHRMSIWKKR